MNGWEGDEFVGSGDENGGHDRCVGHGVKLLRSVGSDEQDGS